MSNVPDVLEVVLVQVKEEAKESTNNSSTVKMKAELINQDTIVLYNKFIQSGRPLRKSEHPDLDKQVFTSLIKFLLSIVVPKEAIYIFLLLKKKANQCLERLKKEEVTLWEEAMQQTIRKESTHMQFSFANYNNIYYYSYQLLLFLLVLYISLTILVHS